LDEAMTPYAANTLKDLIEARTPFPAPKPLTHFVLS
jgi:hypothetical protein